MTENVPLADATFLGSQDVALGNILHRDKVDPTLQKRWALAMQVVDDPLPRAGRLDVPGPHRRARIHHDDSKSLLTHGQRCRLSKVL